jgi:hypothetical protein
MKSPRLLFCACTPSYLSLADREDLTGTSHPMLWVLFSPLSHPRHKGDTHTIPNNSISHISSQGRATTHYPSWVSQLPQKKLSQDKIWQRNVTQARCDNSILFLRHPFCRVLLVTSFQKPSLYSFFI